MFDLTHSKATDPVLPGLVVNRLAIGVVGQSRTVA